MAKKKFLQENGEQVWPINRSDCVYTTDGKDLISNLLENIDYDALLAFDIDEIVFNSSNVNVSETSAILGEAKLNQMVLDGDTE